MHRMQPKEVFVVEINKVYRAPSNDPYFHKMSEPVEQFKAKFNTLKMLKFDPFGMRLSIVGWPKNNKNEFAFYKSKSPPQNMPAASRKMVEHAIIEMGSEKEATHLTKLIAKNYQQSQQPTFCRVVHAYQVFIDDQPLSQNQLLSPPIFENLMPANLSQLDQIEIAPSPTQTSPIAP